MKQIQGTILKAGRDHELIGVVLVADSIDNQKDVVSKTELTKAARWYLQNARAIRFDHDGVDLDGEEVQLAESWVSPPGGIMLEGQHVPGNAWIVKLSISDRLYQKFRSEGPPKGFSVGGSASGSERNGIRHLHDLQIREISILQHGNPAVRQAKVVALKSETPISKSDLEDSLRRMLDMMRSISAINAPKLPAPEYQSWEDYQAEEDRILRERERTSGARYASQQEHVREYKYNTRFMPH